MRRTRVADSVRCLSLCSGIGGLELGIDAALGGRLRVVGYVEREAFAAATLLARMETEALEPAPVWAGNLEDCDYTPFDGNVDLICAGFPCQPWSSAGKRKGTADKRWIWPGIVSVIREVRPRWVFLENVPGLVSGGGLGPVLGDLAVLGYDAEWDRIAAGDVGAPHRRQRVFILGKLADGNGGRRGQRERAACRREPDPERGESRLADDHGGRCGQRAGGAEPEPARRRAAREPTGGNGIVADARRQHSNELPAPGRQSTEQQLGANGAGLADPNRIKRRSISGRPDTEPDGRHNGRGGGTIFPPGPSDRDMWAGLLLEAPQAQPAICKLADGAADWLDSRTDRLRALGNAVVPLQAAVALRTLAHRAGWRI